MLGAGSELGHYRIVRRLGTGGMAAVYEAEDLNLGRRVGLKVLAQEMTRDPQMVARFRSEVRSAAALNHRNIVTVYEVGEHDGMHYYAMRLLTGGDLRDRIGSGMHSREALAVLRELTDAFEHAHKRGFVHRDVKPDNVMFDDEGVPVLTDFGISKALGGGSQMTATGVVIGTPRYFSPEQARGRPVDARSDLYSLGVTFFEMLTGAPPYGGDDIISIVQQHVSEPVPLLPFEHAQLQPLIDGLMAKNPDERLASARELRKAMAALDDPASEGAEHEPVERPRRSSMAATRQAPPPDPAFDPGQEEFADAGEPIDLGVPQPGLTESQQFPAQDDATRKTPWTLIAAGSALVLVGAAASWLFVSMKAGPQNATPVPPAPAVQTVAPPPELPAARPAPVEVAPAAPVPTPVAAPAATAPPSPAAPAAKRGKAAARAPVPVAPSPKAAPAVAPAQPPAPAADPAPAPSATPAPAPAAEPATPVAEPASAPPAAPAPAATPEAAAPPPAAEAPAKAPAPEPASPAPPESPKTGEELDQEPNPAP